MEDENNIDECDEISADIDALPSDELPLLFFDSESTGGSMYNNHIIKVGAKVVAVPDSVSITQHQYGSLIHTSQGCTEQMWDYCTDVIS